MEVNLNIENRKKVISKIAVIFLIIVLLLTFFSKTINNLLLPEVECTAPYAGSLQNSTEAAGAISKSEIVQVFSNGSWQIEKVEVAAGRLIKIGDSLAKIDMKKAELSLMNLKLDVMRAENSLASYKGSFSASGTKKTDEYLRNVKQMEYELQVKKTELSNFEKAIPENGEIKAETAGIISNVYIMPGKNVSEGEPIFDIAKETEKATVTWKLGSSKARGVNITDEVTIRIKEPEETGITTTIENKKYLPQEGIYEFTAELDTDLELQDGQQATIVMGQSDKEYESIVPTSAIVQDSTGTYVYRVETRNGALGEEEYVKKALVTILGQDDFNTAVDGLDSGEGPDIVSYSTKVLYDGVQVKTNK